MNDFIALRDNWRNQLAKEYPEQEFEDDGTALEVNIDTVDDDECCEMIKRKFLTEMRITNQRTGERMTDIKCDVLRDNLERIETTGDEYAISLLKEWDECEKGKNSWKNQLV